MIKHKSAVILLLGLILSQIISTIHVYTANHHLSQKMQALGQAGFFTVPNDFIIETLTRFSSAFYGGIFFTLTIGACVTILTLLVILLQAHFQTYKRILFLLYFLFLGFLVYMINRNGFTLFPTLYVSVLPGTLISGSLLLFHDKKDKRKNNPLFLTLLHIIPLG